MARKKAVYEVQDEGRDKGKKFKLEEMPASKAEKWAARAILAMSKNGIEIPDGIADAGFAGIASYGLTMVGKLPWDEAEYLFDEMFRCVTIMPNPNDPELSRALIEDDIEEISTRVKLRIAVFKLHADFFSAVAHSISARA